MCGLINYVLRSMLYLDRKRLIEVFMTLISLINKTFGIEIDFRKNENCILLQDYMEGKLELKQYEKEYQKNRKLT